MIVDELNEIMLDTVMEQPEAKTIVPLVEDDADATVPAVQSTMDDSTTAFQVVDVDQTLPAPANGNTSDETVVIVEAATAPVEVADSSVVVIDQTDENTTALETPPVVIDNSDSNGVDSGTARDLVPDDQAPAAVFDDEAADEGAESPRPAAQDEAPVVVRQSVVEVIAEEPFPAFVDADANTSTDPIIEVVEETTDTVETAVGEAPVEPTIEPIREEIRETDVVAEPTSEAGA
jgi:hypothetical protein